MSSSGFGEMSASGPRRGEGVSASGSRGCPLPQADAPETATAADGTHPIEMHSCFGNVVSKAKTN